MESEKIFANIEKRMSIIKRDEKIFENRKNNLQKNIEKVLEIQSKFNLKDDILPNPTIYSETFRKELRNEASSKDIINKFKVLSNEKTRNSFKLMNNQDRFRNTITSSHSSLNFRKTLYIPKMSYHRQSEFKKNSIFQSPKEDKIIEDIKVKDSIEFIKRIKTLHKLKEDNRGIIKVFKLSEDTKKKILAARNKKRRLDLDSYQKNLIQSVSDVLSKDSLRILEQKFNTIKKKANEIKITDKIQNMYDEIKEQDDITVKTLKESHSKLFSFRQESKTKL